MDWIKTSGQLPPENPNTFLLGEGGVSGHIHGRYAVMCYDGDWWNEDGTELSSPPDFWTYIYPPN